MTRRTFLTVPVAALLPLEFGSPHTTANPASASNTHIPDFPTPAPENADRNAILQGVSEIGAPGLPGGVGLVSARAFAVLVGQGGAEAVVAAGPIGRGRVVAFGHDGYLGKDALAVADTGRLVRNAVRWAGADRPGLRVGVLTGAGDALGFLRKQGVAAEELAETGGSRQLGRFDVVVGALSRVPDNELYLYRRWAMDGGGLVVAETGWGWQMLHPELLLARNGSNVVLADAGILFTDGTPDRTTANGYSARVAVSPYGNASLAFELLRTGGGTPAEQKTAMATTSRVLSALSPDDRNLLPDLRQFSRSSRADFAQIGSHPIPETDPADRLALLFQVREAQSLPAEQVVAHPSAMSFPGPVPSSADRKPGTVVVNGNRGAREGTGFYAPPGELVTITVPKSVVGRGVRVRVGGHTDTLWHLPTWKRAPQISRTFPVDGETVRVANAFGGTIYLDMPAAPLGMIPITVRGAVRQPRFVAGEPSPMPWSEVRLAPAPFAELEGRNCILTVPSAVVRSLENPDALMAYWDEVLRHVSDLYAVPRDRPRPERYCVDVQISAGYMHSGYPIMTGDDVAPTFVDLKILRGDDAHKTWGFYHEVGHNYQQEDWTWDGCGEVTNNLFSLYGGEKMHDIFQNGDYVRTHPAVLPPERNARLAKYRAAGTPYETWKSDPFLALTLFIQLRQAFGWEPFTQLFAAYQALPAKEHPTTDLEKRDQFMTRFSRAVNKNLAPFFTAWGVPTSPDARASLAGLPDWAGSPMG